METLVNSYVRCEGCDKPIGRIIFSWTDPAEIEVLDLGMLLWPEIALCEACFSALVGATKGG